MDISTKVNAENSRETAFSSGELSTQAGELNEVVKTLVDIVHGARRNGDNSGSQFVSDDITVESKLLKKSDNL